AISVRMHRPVQNAEKLPATRPERMLSEAPPCRDEVTTSLVWRLSVDVKIFVNSGISAPAIVPSEMMVESTHHRSGPAAGWWARRRLLATYVTMIDTMEVIQTRLVSGCSRLKSFALPQIERLTASLTQ